MMRRMYFQKAKMEGEDGSGMIGRLWLARRIEDERGSAS